MTDTTRAHVHVRGLVQGVCFRADTRARARSLDLSGWVRNCDDGGVEAVFEGDADRVASMVDWCRRGPSGARVDEVSVEWERPQGNAGFYVA